MATALCTWVAWWIANRRVWGSGLRRGLRVAAVMVLIQLALGVATLLLAVPVWVAVAHQLGAVALLAAVLWSAAGAFDARAAVSAQD